MRPLSPLLRIPPAVTGRRARRRPAGLVLAFTLLLVAVAPASGSPPAPRASDADGAATGGLRLGPGQLQPPAPAIPRAQPPAAEPLPDAPPPGTTSLVSASRANRFAAGPSSAASISENGRWVAFASSAPDLVAKDGNHAQDVFVRDRRTGTTVRIPLPGGGAPPAGGTASEPAISADGSVVAFTYVPPPPTSTIFVPCTAARVLLWHRETGQTEIASITPDDELHCGATSPAVSGDGRYVAFVGPVAFGFEGTFFTQVFVRDMNGGTTTLVSVAAGGAAGGGGMGNANSRNPAVSRDGAVVAFDSDADNLVGNDGNEASDVFARRIPAGPTELISAAPGGPANGPSLAPAISANGSLVAFESLAQNLVPAAAAGSRNVYVRDRAAGTTRIVSTAPDGAAAKGDTGQAAIGGDGRVVAFASVAQNLVASAGNAILAAAATPPAEVYARDLVSGELIRISEARAGGPAGLVNVQPTIGGNGRFVAFTSNSPNLVRGDGNNVSDIYLRELPPVPTIAPNPLDFGARALGEVGPPIAAVVTNGGWSALAVRAVGRTGPAAGDFSVVFNGCDGKVLHRGESCPITVTFAPGGSGERVATLTVDHNGLKPPATAGLHGSSSNAKLEIKPPVGRPGIVVIVTGSGFPPNTEVTLAWSKGISPRLPRIVTDGRGGFRVQVLVFHNDVIGSRDLVVSPVGKASFPPFGTSFLVTESASEPPRFEPGGPVGVRQPTLVYRH